MSLGTEVRLGPGHIVLDGDPAPAPAPKEAQHLLFSTHVYCGKRSPISATDERLLDMQQDIVGTLQGILYLIQFS